MRIVGWIAVVVGGLVGCLFVLVMFFGILADLSELEEQQAMLVTALEQEIQARKSFEDVVNQDLEELAGWTETVDQDLESLAGWMETVNGWMESRSTGYTASSTNYTAISTAELDAYESLVKAYESFNKALDELASYGGFSELQRHVRQGRGDWQKIGDLIRTGGLRFLIIESPYDWNEMVREFEQSVRN